MSIRIPRSSLAPLLMLAVVMTSCGSGSSSSTPPTQAATSTSLALSNSTITAGSSVTLTATVTSSGSPVTTGSVTFYNGSTSLATAALNSSGQASWSSASFSAGSYALTASYGGTSAYYSSTSAAATLTVNKPLAQTTVTLVENPASAAQGLPVELVATVSAGSGAGSAVPTGTVTFSSGSTTLGAAALDSTEESHFTSTLLAVGSDSIAATYSGDTNFSSSTSSAETATISAPMGTTYTNPLTLKVSSTLNAVSCADPAIIKAQTAGVDTWYLYCTSDALYAGDPNPHYINIFQSSDLVNWTYDGNAFPGLPTWANISGASLWAPAIKYFNNQYYLYYAASETSLSGNGSAIGVGTSASPAGPFVDSGSPVVEPELATNCCSGSYRSTIDPDEIQDTAGQRYILFGSFTGGLYVRTLSADGLTSDKTSEQQVAVDNRYEGGNWWYHDGYYYLFASSTNCCNGPLSGYGVFVGRATTPFGPYVDAQGISMLAVNPGGTPVIHMNGNSVIGPGGNVIFEDESGQNYILYHGILSATPYYAGDVGYTARPGFIDAIDWINGWPVARGGFGPSDSAAPQPVPAAQPGGTNSYTTVQSTEDSPRSAIAALSDDFTESTLSSQWSFIHSTATYTLNGNGYQVDSVGYDPIGGMAKVPLLAESAPAGDYMVETELDLNLPVSGVGQNYAQAGLLLYDDDNDFIRADLYNNNDTRQVEFIKAQVPQASGYPSWGATNLGTAAINTEVTVWLRIVRKNVNGQEMYTAYSSNDGSTWIEGGTWIHSLGSNEKICLYAGNQAGYDANFHYVHVSTLE
ncbi:MAG TPA: family 43 glycosylhydrolase [Terracidiphilus sp.]|nr:family 43 glycosylhydrolase [Terracidiphilus sp.]